MSKKYRPYTRDELLELVQKGPVWIREKVTEISYAIIGVEGGSIDLCDGNYTFDFVLDNYTHIDGTPFGVEVEEEDKLFLIVDSGSLIVCYGNLNREIGHINQDGQMYMLNTPAKRKSWEQWYKNGMKTDESVVEWKGRKYYITNNYCLRCNSFIGGSNIYDFEECIPKPDCADENIKRHLNDTPILF